MGRAVVSGLIEFIVHGFDTAPMFSKDDGIADAECSVLNENGCDSA